MAKYVLLEAMSLRDGGTTSVELCDERESRITYTFDYSLPWDGRGRVIRMHDANGVAALPIGGLMEREACIRVRALLVNEFGESVVRAVESGAGPNPGKDKWLYAFAFLRLAYKEGKFDA